MSEQPNSDNSRQDALRTARKQITRSLLLALAALGVIVIACYAWFVRNTTVSGALGSISAGTGNFELASVGGVGAFDDDTPNEYRIIGADWPSDSNPTGTITTSGKETILWRLDDQSNLGNQSGNTGIRPGSYGKLVFYVVPKQSGTLTLSFDLELIPMDEKKEPITHETANQLIRGHMLFSFQYTQDKNYNSSSSPTLINYMNPTFSLTFENAVENTPILVELNWIWPLLLEHIQKSQLHNVCSGEPILAWMNETPECFFYNGGSVVSAPTNLTEQFRDYNDYFNNADQFIGENMDWLMVRLSAQQS